MSSPKWGGGIQAGFHIHSSMSFGLSGRWNCFFIVLFFSFLKDKLGWSAAEKTLSKFDLIRIFCWILSEDYERNHKESLDNSCFSLTHLEFGKFHGFFLFKTYCESFTYLSPNCNYWKKNCEGPHHCHLIRAIAWCCPCPNIYLDQRFFQPLPAFPLIFLSEFLFNYWPDLIVLKQPPLG